MQREWNLVLMRASEVAPEAVIESARRSGNSRLEDEIDLVMCLWAAKEPARAWAWLEENAGSRRRNLERSYIVGLTRNNPTEALAFAIDPRRDVGQPEVISALLSVVADERGMQAMDQCMEQVAVRTEVPEHVKELFFRHAAEEHERAIAAGADPSRSLQWIERFTREPWAKDWHFASIANLAARQNPAATMAWVDAVGGRMTDEQVQWCSVRVIQNWVEQSLDGALTWMKGSPDHRFREQLFQEGALALHRLGKAEEGRRWAEASDGVPFSELVQAALDHEKLRAAR
jgi:hypothetical protein